MKRAYLICRLIAFLSVLWAFTANGQEVTKVGTTAAKFLSIPVGPRALGMGGAFVSLADDATAMYWNPGGLAKLSQKEIFLMHSRWLADINFDFIALALPIGEGGVAGINVTALTLDEMEVTTEEFPEGTSETFSASSFAAGISYAHNLTDRFSIGANIKYITEKISVSSASSIAIDIGTLFTTPFAGIRLGASISNFGAKMQISGDDLLVQQDIAPRISGNNPNVNAFLGTGKFDLPLLLRIGVSWDAMKNENSRLTLAVDGAHPNDNTEFVNAGGEWALLGEKIFLRAGYKSAFLKDSEEQLTVGGGLHYDIIRGYNVSLDYAFEQFEHLDNVHKFALSLKF